MKTIKLDNLAAAHTHAALVAYIKGLQGQLKKAHEKGDTINSLRLNSEIDSLEGVLNNLD